MGTGVVGDSSTRVTTGAPLDPAEVDTTQAPADGAPATSSTRKSSAVDEDGYGMDVHGPDSGPGYDAGWDELDQEINDVVFAPNGIPYPGNASTTPQVHEQLKQTTEYGRALEAARQLDGSPGSVQRFMDALNGLPLFGNIMERLLCVIKDSVRESNESAKYHLYKLNCYNTISKAIAEQQSKLADASSALAKKEKGSDHPEKETVRIEVELYDTDRLGPDGKPAVKDTQSETCTRQSLSTRSKEQDSAAEEVRNGRSAAQTQYQAEDQRKNQLLQIVASCSKTMNEERSVGINNTRL